jgi:hypothetical protein
MRVRVRICRQESSGKNVMRWRTALAGLFAVGMFKGSRSDTVDASTWQLAKPPFETGAAGWDALELAVMLDCKITRVFLSC